MPSNKPFAVITAGSPLAHRRAPNVPYPEDQKKFAAQSVVVSNSWGMQPAMASITYVGNKAVVNGSQVKIDVAGQVYYGLCKSDVPVTSSTGNTRTLEFVDHREELVNWDDCYCAFNKVETVQVGGVRVRRYYHILPSDFLSGVKSYLGGNGYAAMPASQTCRFERYSKLG